MRFQILIAHAKLVCLAIYSCLKKNNPYFVLPTADINFEPNRPTALRPLSACSCQICEIAIVNELNPKKTYQKA